MSAVAKGAGREKPEAKAVRSGYIAFDNGIARSACPYLAPLDRFWRLGWNIRNRAKRRWDAYPDQVDAILDKASPFIDRGTLPGKVALSRLIALNFYAMATSSAGPDAAWEWFQATMRIQRRSYAAALHPLSDAGSERGEE